MDRARFLAPAILKNVIAQNPIGIGPGGQIKLLHPWPGQNPPPLRRGDG
jgi:hypothetical protein